MRPKLPLNLFHVQKIAGFLCGAVNFSVEQGRATPFFRGLDLLRIAGVALDEVVRLNPLWGLGELENNLIVEAPLADRRVKVLPNFMGNW